MLATNLRDRQVFLYGFAKNEQDNVDDDELRALKLLAQTYLGMDEETIARLVEAGELTEVKMANRRLRKELLETARGLYELGAVRGKTMREFESLRVEAPKIYSAYEIKRLRLREKASQAVFAAYLNTSVSTVLKWEIGEKKPSGPALKLLDIVERKGLKALA